MTNVKLGEREEMKEEEEHYGRDYASTNENSNKMKRK